MNAVNETLGNEIMTLEHKIKSVDQNLDDKLELAIEEANNLQKNMAESIQANNKSLELFDLKLENAIETMIGVNESLWKELKIGDEFIDNKMESAVQEINDIQGTSLRPKPCSGIDNRNKVSVSGSKTKI
jgi:hypothetical protein